MTCIIGLIENGAIYFGADSAVSTHCTIKTFKEAKIFRKGNILMGVSGPPRVKQLLHYTLKIPAHPKKESIEKYICTRFVDAARKCFKAGGYAKREHGVETGGYFLVGYKGQLFTVYGDYQALCATYNYAAIGSGEEVALGSLHTMQATKQTPETRIRKALLAAEEFSRGVRGPFTFLTLKEAEHHGN